MSKLAESLFALRTAKGMSQEEVAKIIGVTRAAVQQWEKGKTVPTLDKLSELARFFGVSIAVMTGAEPVTTSIDNELRMLPEETRDILKASFLETIKQFKARQKH